MRSLATLLVVVTVVAVGCGDTSGADPAATTSTPAPATTSAAAAAPTTVPATTTTTPHTVAANWLTPQAFEVPFSVNGSVGIQFQYEVESARSVIFKGGMPDSWVHITTYAGDSPDEVLDRLTSDERLTVTEPVADTIAGLPATYVDVTTSERMKLSSLGPTWEIWPELPMRFYITQGTDPQVTIVLEAPAGASFDFFVKEAKAFLDTLVWGNPS